MRFCSLLLLVPAVVQGVPSGFVDELITKNLLKLTNSGAFATTSTGDAFLFLGSKNGQVSVMVNPTDDGYNDESDDGSDDGSDDRPSSSYLLLSLPVCTNGERGLQTVLPHPDFATNGYLYVYRTEMLDPGCALDYVDGPQNRLSRFTVDIDSSGVPSIDGDSEISLFRGPIQNWKNHNGGGMAFGNDGLLYVTIGDGGLAPDNHGQDPKTLNGNVLRLTEIGEVPPGNAFVGTDAVRCNETGRVPPGSNYAAMCSEIYAIGLRNPFRLSMDPNTKDKVRFYFGDVGGKTWEEISECGTGYSGANYGWKLREGPCKRDSEIDCDEVEGLVDPVYWYGHRRQSSGGAITGGTFVPNGVWPSEYDNTYLYVDYTFNEMYHLIEGGEDCRTCSPPTSAFRNTTFHEAKSVVDIFFGPYEDTQALYYLGFRDNSLRRIRYTGSGNRSPVSVLQVGAAIVVLGEEVQFDASASSDPDDDVLTYLWDFGDGSTSREIAPLYTYPRRGQYQVELTVADSSGLTSHSFQIVLVGEAPIVEINSPGLGATFAVGDLFTLSGKAWNMNSNGTKVYLDRTEWEVQQHHAEHYHPFLAPTEGNNIMIDPAPPPEDYVAASNSFLRVILTGYNLDGLSTTVTRDIMPRVSYLSIVSEPSGVQVSVDGSLVTTPVRVLAWEDQEMLVGVEDQGGRFFREWSNGEDRQHIVKLPPGEDPTREITARFFFLTQFPSISPSLDPSVVPSPTETFDLFPSGMPSSLPTDFLDVIPLVRPVRKDCSIDNPCGRCQGHCRSDDECGDGLICFYKDRGVMGEDSVPGCSGHDLSLTDWCTVGSRPEDKLIALVKPLKNTCSAQEPCGRCEGKCKADDDCEDDLICFRKGRGIPGFDSVPGCIGESLSKADWCTTAAAVERLLPLVLKDKCTSTSPCGECEGHCKFDVDCGEGLICFYKDAGGEGVVPGCAGTDKSPKDWCVVGVRPEEERIPLVKPITTSCSAQAPCGRCEGRCKSDQDCAGDLVCFEKDRGVPGFDSVPGCIGESLSKADWCTTRFAIEEASAQDRNLRGSRLFPS